MSRVRGRILEDRRRQKSLGPLKSFSEPSRNNDRWEDDIAPASLMAMTCITSGGVNLKGTGGPFVRGDDSESSLAERNKASSHLNIRTSRRGGGDNKTNTVNSLTPCTKHSVRRISRFLNLQPSIDIRLQASKSQPTKKKSSQ